jgi:hypothetical protein
MVFARVADFGTCREAVDVMARHLDRFCDWVWMGHSLVRLLVLSSFRFVLSWDLGGFPG